MPYKDPVKAKKYGLEWAKKKRKKQRASGTRTAALRKSRYGITQEEWDALFKQQGSRCAICRTDKPHSKVGWHTDHDHGTKKVRGILCENCNRGLGMYADDLTFLRSAMVYLGHHQGVLSGDTIERARVFSPFNQRTRRAGASFGKSFCGYDIRIEQDLVLPPKKFSLASSVEYFDIPNDCVAFVHDKSTYARRGLSLFNTVAEPGWRGYLTLELFNASDETIELKAGDPIAQIILFALDQPVDGYDGKYQDQKRGVQEAIFEK